MIDVPLYEPWIQPELAADGTMGGDSCACTTTNTVNNIYSVFYAFNKNRIDGLFPSLYNATAGADMDIIFYSPDKLKISQIELLIINTNVYAMLGYVIQCSNDGETWTDIYSGTLSTSDLVYGNSIFCIIPEELQAGNKNGWNYVKLIGTSTSSNGNYINFPKVFITAQQHYSTTKASNGHVRVIDDQYYEHEIDEYDFCGAFVIDDSKKTVRLPNYNNTFLMGGNKDNIGYSIPAALPNIYGSSNWQGVSPAHSAAGAFASTVTLDQGETYGHDGRLNIVHFTFDASNCSPIYSNNCTTVQPPAIRVNWCIQAKKITSTPSTPTDPPTTPSTQEFAHTDLKNVTAPVQAFKDMSMRWGMPDYSAGLDITSYLYKPGDFYTVPYDCIICAKCIYNTGILLYTEPNKTATLDNMKEYLFLAADGQSGPEGDSCIVSYAYCDANTMLYADSVWYNTGTIIMYPLKGSKL